MGDPVSRVGYNGAMEALHITDKLKDIKLEILQVAASRDDDARKELWRRRLGQLCELHLHTVRLKRAGNRERKDNDK